MKVVLVSIIGTCVLIALVHFLKPSLIYTETGRIRQFGIGWRKKTVIPIWLTVFIIAIFCYSLAYIYVDE